MKKRFLEEQFIGLLPEAYGGASGVLFRPLEARPISARQSIKEKKTTDQPRDTCRFTGQVQPLEVRR